MKTTIAAALAAAGMWAAGASAAGEPPLSARVLGVFTAHCVECHGPDLSRPKGRFGYVTDLRRLVDEGHVIAGSADESPLFELLVATDAKYRMPPRSAKGGPLSEEQVRMVREWIDSGAAVAVRSETGAGGGASPGVSAPSAAEPTIRENRSLGERLFVFTGKFHPVVVHFPIALLMVGALAEGLVLMGRSWAREASRLLVPLGAVAAVVATVLGLVSASAEGYATATIWTHRLVGIVASVLAVGAAGLRWAGKVWPYRLVLFAAAVLTGLAGHFGGVIVHGEDHFAW